MKSTGLHAVCLSAFLAVVMVAVLGCGGVRGDGASGRGDVSPDVSDAAWQRHVSPDASERIGRSLIGPDLLYLDVRRERPQTEWMDDVLTSACNVDRNPDNVPTSWYGRQRVWRSAEQSTPSGLPQLRVHQFSGAFGISPVAHLIDYVRPLVNCNQYSDRQGDHVMLGELVLSGLEDDNTAFGYCEMTPEVWFRGELRRETRHQCTVIVGRDDIATRIQVDAEDLQRAREVSRELADMAVQALGAAW